MKQPSTASGMTALIRMLLRRCITMMMITMVVTSISW